MLRGITQDNRPVSISSPLGKDVLLFRRMSVKEELGRLFQINIDLLSEDPSIKLPDILGQNITVSLDLNDDETRYFNGFVSRFAQVGEEGRLSRYQATVSPWLWFLTRTSDCRIFQEMTVPDIIKKVFRDAGFSDFEDKLNGSYRQWVYCVQYRETDFNFVSRLMEQEGIYYFFQHEDGKHMLVLSDGYSSHEPVSGYEEIPYYPPSGNTTQPEHVSSWVLSQQIQPGSYTLDEYDFERPKADLLVRSNISRQHQHAEYEIYDYPGEYPDSSDGDNYVKARIEELQSQYEILEGESDARGIMVGALFNLTNYPRSDQNREYLITSAEHFLQVGAYEGPLEGSDGPTYHCELTAIDAKENYRSSRITPKPLVQGPQTAVVVGKSGEEIWTDKYGRVKVQFHWDREGKLDENSSCWIRVSHPWAGKGWGAVATPRIGQEVIVSFLEGDPDQPIITGRVYNGDNAVPHGFPAGAVISGVKSNSTKGGGGYNEYVFDDTKGNELIREHGQFDKDSTIENDLREHVLNDRSRDVTNNETISVGNDQSISIGNNQDFSIGNNQTGTIGADKSITVGANHTESIGANQSITVGSNKTETVTINTAETIGVAKELTIGGAYQVTVGAVMNETVGGAKAEEIGAAKSVNVALNSSENIGKNKTVDAGSSITEQAGKDFNMSSGKKMILSAGDDFSLAGMKKGLIDIADELTIKCGSAMISMKKNGDITIKGKKITVKGSDDIVIKGKKVLQN